MTKLFKSITKNIITFLLVFTILFQSLYFNPKKVDAALPAAAAIAGYVISVIGAVDMGTGGGVRKIASDARSSLERKISDLMGTSIYEDANGNIVFNGTATQQIYETLLGSGAYNAIPISDFPISSSFQAPNTFSADPLCSYAINSKIADLGSNSLVFYGSNNEFSYRNTYCDCVIVDTSNIAYYVVEISGPSIKFTFYSNNGQTTNANIYKFVHVYDQSTGEYKSYKSYTDSNNCAFIGTSIDGNISVVNKSVNVDCAQYLTNQLSLMANFNYGCVGSKRSIILATNSNYGLSYSTKNTGITVNNVYKNIPTISNNVLTNNNWDTVYNNYIQNIQNQSSQYITNNTNTIDISSLRRIMKQYGDQILDAVNQGIENIVEYVSVTNEWLNRIYQLLAEINSKLDNGGGSSGGTVSGSTVDLSNIESYLQSLNTSISAMQTQLDYIKNNLPDHEQQLSQIYTVLTNIYQSLQNLPSGGVTDPNSDPYQPWYPKFFALPDADILDTIGQIQVIEALLAGLVPLCYVTGLGAVVNALGVQPVTPVFTIPVEMNNPIMTVDEDIEIDLSMFEDVRDYIVGGEVILFMLSLGYFTIWLLKFLLDILGKN